MKNLSCFLALFLLGSFSLVFAQVPVRIPVNVFQTTSGANVTTYAAGVLTAAGLPGSTFSASGGPLVLDVLQRQSLLAGRVLDVTARVVPNSLGVAKAVGNLAAKASGIGYALVVGAAVYDLAKELGYTPNAAVAGSPLTFTQVKYVVSWSYSCQYGSASSIEGCIANQQAAWRSYGASSCVITFAGWVANPVTFAGSVYLTGSAVTTTGGCYNDSAPGIRHTPSLTTTATPRTLQDFEADIAARSGWPSTSAISRAVTDAVASGEPLALPSPSSVTGPASVAGPTSVVSKPAVGTSPASTVTNNTTNNITYGPNTVTVTQVTTSTSTDSDVAPITTTQEPPPTPKSDCELRPTSIGCSELGAMSDKPLPGPPVLYKPKYPDGLTGVWDEKIAGIKASPLFNAASNLMPSVASGGSCPVWMLPLNVGIKDFGSHDVAPPCWIWTFGRFVIVVSALLLARSLIFGG